MDVIVIGVYSEREAQIIDDIILLSDSLKVIWSYEKYNLESQEGITEMEQYFNLFKTGVLISDTDNVIASYSIINEISTYYEITEWNKQKCHTPSLFSFFKQLEKVGIERFVIAFADAWRRDTIVRVEKIKLNKLSQRLNSFYVWCESYLNLVTNSEIREDSHPLILDIDSISNM